MENPESFEKASVHQVYNEIAEHFSSTRYKPWPVVESFVKAQDKYTLGGDIGSGNGKYLNIADGRYMIGLDRSKNLVEISSKNGNEGIVADGLSLPIKNEAFDFAISIAVVHHFSTVERRREAIKEILRTVREGGQAMIYVWALEQEKDSKRKFETQDEMVSWTTGTKVYKRYYHLFVKGELEELVEFLDCIVTKSGYDKDNHYVILEKQTKKDSH